MNARPAQSADPLLPVADGPRLRHAHGVPVRPHGRYQDAAGGWGHRLAPAHGEWILANGRVPDRDLFSFTMPDRPWFAWEWGWDVAFAWLHAHAGLAAVVLASLVLLSLTFALLFRLARRKSRNALVAIAATLLAMAGSSIHWLARPHLVTLLMMVVFYGILERVRRDARRGFAPQPAAARAAAPVDGGVDQPARRLRGRHRDHRVLRGGRAARALFDPALRPRPRSRRGPPLRARRGRLFRRQLRQPLLLPPARAHCALPGRPPAVPIEQRIPAAELRSSRRRSISNAACFWPPPPAAGTSTTSVSRKPCCWPDGGIWRCIRSATIPSSRWWPPRSSRRPFANGRARSANARVRDWARAAVRRFERMAGEMGETDAIPRLHLFSAAAAGAAAFLLFDPAASFKFQPRFDPGQVPRARRRTPARRGPETPGLHQGPVGRLPDLRAVSRTCASSSTAAAISTAAISSRRTW